MSELSTAAAALLCRSPPAVFVASLQQLQVLRSAAALIYAIALLLLLLR
jgi:hypothetical protein